MDSVVILNHVGYVLDCQDGEVVNIRKALRMDESLCRSFAIDILDVWQTACKQYLPKRHNLASDSPDFPAPAVDVTSAYFLSLWIRMISPV